MTALAAGLDVVGFAGCLREVGLPVRTSDLITLLHAVGRLEPVSAARLYWSCRACMGVTPDQVERFDAVFAAWFIGARDAVATPQDHATMAVRGEHGEDADGEAVGWAVSERERLRRLRLDLATDREMAAIEQMLTGLWRRLPHRRTRRTTPASRGRELDVRRSMASALRTGGEVVKLSRRRRRRAPRRLVLLLDVSGSMAGFTRPLLHQAHRAARDGRQSEVFCFGTRLTRVTQLLGRRRTAHAFEALAEDASDWGGGTRLGTSLRQMHTTWGHRGALRGSIVVVCSDGLDGGDADELGRQMGRLARQARSVLWVSPLAGGPGYEPIQRGIRAARPHVDQLMSGRTLAGLEDLVRLIGSEDAQST